MDVWLESSDGEGELGHGMKVSRAAVDQLLHELGDIGAGGPFGRQIAHLLLGRNLASQQKPEEAYPLAWTTGQLSTSAYLRAKAPCRQGLWEELLAFGNRLSTESNALLGIEDGPFPD